MCTKHWIQIVIVMYGVICITWLYAKCFSQKCVIHVTSSVLMNLTRFCLDPEDVAPTLHRGHYNWYWNPADSGKDYCTGTR